MIIGFCDGGYDSKKKEWFGSYKIFLSNERDVKEAEHQRTYFPEVNTNNEAEYKSLHTLLTKIYTSYEKDLPISIMMDSQLVVKQVNEQWKIKAKNLRDYYRDIIKIKTELDDFSLAWVSRKLIVKILGH